MQDEFRLIPLGEIVEPWIVLRVVNRSSVEYLELRDSLADKGFLNSICVRPSRRKPGKVEVVDGLYRHAAACELRLPAVPAIVKHNLSDEDVLAAQIQANALRPETTPMEYARQIRKIMAAKPETMTLAELSARIHKNPEWIGHQLSLLDLMKDAQKAVERGEISLAAAYALARVPRIRQRHFMELAKTTPTKEFLPLVNGFVKKFREGIVRGRLDDLYKDFEPVPHLRHVKDVLAEYRNHQSGGLLVSTAGCKSPVDAWYLALQWVLHLDEPSVNEQRERVLERQRKAILEREEEESQP
jgi:ParB/RepB/Spo0J family partition protein